MTESNGGGGGDTTVLSSTRLEPLAQNECQGVDRNETVPDVGIHTLKDCSDPHAPYPPTQDSEETALKAKNDEQSLRQLRHEVHKRVGRSASVASLSLRVPSPIDTGGFFRVCAVFVTV